MRDVHSFAVEEVVDLLDRRGKSQVSMNSPVDLSNDVAKDFYESGDDGETTYLVTYLVSGNEIYYPYYEDVPANLQDEQNDTGAHHQIWDYFTALIQNIDPQTPIQQVVPSPPT